MSWEKYDEQKKIIESAKKTIESATEKMLDFDKQANVEREEELKRYRSYLNNLKNTDDIDFIKSEFSRKNAVGITAMGNQERSTIIQNINIDDEIFYWCIYYDIFIIGKTVENIPTLNYSRSLVLLGDEKIELRVHSILKNQCLSKLDKLNILKAFAEKFLDELEDDFDYQREKEREREKKMLDLQSLRL